MVRHLPPSEAELRLLDVTQNTFSTTLELLRLRPDLRLIRLDSRMIRPNSVVLALPKLNPAIRLLQAYEHQLPLPTAILDAIVGYDVYAYAYGAPGVPAAKAAFLVEALRVLRPGGRLILFEPSYYWLDLEHFTPEAMARTLEAAGFARVFAENTLAGTLSRGEKPYPSAQAKLPMLAPELDQVRGRYLFLLVKQTPNKPVWALKPDEVITWGTATTLDQGMPTALTFSSLPKAVAFMQAAIMENRLSGINKVAKFDKTVAAQWDFPTLINPSLDMLSESSRYTLPGPLIGVDPATAITGDE